jgi:hypothetical protein
MEVVRLVPDVEPLPHEGLGPRKLQSWKKKNENDAQREEKKKSNLINIQLNRKHQDAAKLPCSSCCCLPSSSHSSSAGAQQTGGISTCTCPATTLELLGDPGAPNLGPN